jgi:hypothetical protein
MRRLVRAILGVTILLVASARVAAAQIYDSAGEFTLDVTSLRGRACVLYPEAIAGLETCQNRLPAAIAKLGERFKTTPGDRMIALLDLRNGKTHTGIVALVIQPDTPSRELDPEAARTFQAGFVDLMNKELAPGTLAHLRSEQLRVNGLQVLKTVGDIGPPPGAEPGHAIFYWATTAVGKYILSFRSIPSAADGVDTLAQDVVATMHALPAPPAWSPGRPGGVPPRPDLRPVRLDCTVLDRTRTLWGHDLAEPASTRGSSSRSIPARAARVGVYRAVTRTASPSCTARKIRSIPGSVFASRGIVKSPFSRSASALFAAMFPMP